MMDSELAQFSAKEAFKILCLYLAQKADPVEPHQELGFPSQQAAFEAIAKKFASKPNTVKNERDAFDAVSSSDRRGWQRELRPALKQIWDRFGSLPRADLLNISRRILDFDWVIDMSNELPELPDLSEIIAECGVRLSSFEPSLSINISDQLWSEIRKVYLSRVRNDKVDIVGGHTFWITTPDDKFLAISVQEFPRCWAAIPYVEPIKKYEKIVDELALALGYTSRSIATAKRDVFGKLPSAEWRTSADPEKKIDQNKIDKIDQFLRSRFSDDQISLDRFKKFLEDPVWSGVSKQLSRLDWIEAAIQAVGGWLAVGAARRGELVQALASMPNIDEGLKTAISESRSGNNSPRALGGERMLGGENILYYGAPGTGKSYTAKTSGDHEGAKAFRTVFHPDMQNSDFVGSLKPAISEKGDVSYKFRPGPFSRAIRYARDNPSERVHLVIEELNRAMAAAVFGELFQLLDRNKYGASEYAVEAPSDEFAEWYGEEIIKLPSNLWILATMNSADQGVYPLDTAFRRRWRQVYVPLDYNKAPTGNITIIVDLGVGSKIPWPIFVETLNNFLAIRLDIPEDRLVGPRFLSEAELESGDLPGKLLIYLWDDLLRHHGRNKLFSGTIRTYGSLDKAVNEKQPIFNADFLAALPLSQSEIVDE